MKTKLFLVCVVYFRACYQLYVPASGFDRWNEYETSLVLNLVLKKKTNCSVFIAVAKFVGAP